MVNVYISYFNFIKFEYNQNLFHVHVYMLIKALKSLFVCLIVNFKPADIFYHVTFNPGLVKFGGKN